LDEAYENEAICSKKTRTLNKLNRICNFLLLIFTWHFRIKEWMMLHLLQIHKLYNMIHSSISSFSLLSFSLLHARMHMLNYVFHAENVSILQKEHDEIHDGNHPFDSTSIKNLCIREIA